MAFWTFRNGCIKSKLGPLFGCSAEIHIELSDKNVGFSVDSGLLNHRLESIFELRMTDIIRDGEPNREMSIHTQCPRLQD
jgi:hypothetical protein